jgi:hypothetical protein
MRVLRKIYIFIPKMDEVALIWRKLHKTYLRDFYFTPSVIRIINSRRMRLSMAHGVNVGEN